MISSLPPLPLILSSPPRPLRRSSLSVPMSVSSPVPVRTFARASCPAKNAPTITTITVSKMYSRFIQLPALELPPIGWQLFILGSSQSDSTAFPSFLATYATRLLAEPLRVRRTAEVPEDPNISSTLTLTLSARMAQDVPQRLFTSWKSRLRDRDNTRQKEERWRPIRIPTGRRKLPESLIPTWRA